MSLRWSALLLVLPLAACMTTGGVYHRVDSGETLYRISRTYGVDERYLARVNGISDPTRLQGGSLVYIPGAKQVRDTASVTARAAATKPAGKPATVAPTRAPASAKATAKTGKGKTSRKTADRQPAPTATKTSPAATSPVKSSRPAPAVVAGRFLWPLHGETLRRFGGSGATPSKGMEIGAKTNTPVIAAAAGRVIYSGDGIRSYGNLIIVKHDESFFTVYGYNERNLVQTGGFVSKGEKIALVGTPPEGGKPRLYFELRYGKEAVDPTIYLP